MVTRTTQERLEKLVLHRDLIIEKANLKGANIPLNSDYPEIIAGIARITIGLDTVSVEELLDSILGEIVTGDYTVKGQAIKDAKEAIRQALITMGVDTPVETLLSVYATKVLSIVSGIPEGDVEALLDTINSEVVAGDYTVKGQATISSIAAIETSIAAKNVEVPPNAKLSELPALIGSIQTGGGTPDWQYPNEWPEIRNVGDDEILLLVTDLHRLRFMLGVGSGTFTVTWGDGTSNDYSGYLPMSTHDYTGATGYTIDPLSGRKLWLVRITPTGSSHLTGFKAYRPYDTYGPSTTPIIAAAFGGQYFSAWYDGQHGPFSNTGYKTYSTQLVYCKIKSFGTATDATGLFRECYSLKSVDLPASFGTLTNLTDFFYYCRDLQKVTLPDWGSVTTLSSLFYGCSSLEEVTLPNSWGDRITTTQVMFQDCSRLKGVTIPATWNNVTTTSNMFSSCRTLESITLPTSWGKVTNVNYMFSSCRSLTNLILPVSWDDVTDVSGFLSNTGLPSISIPPFTKVTNASSLFSGCSRLVSCEFQGWGVVTNISGMFYGCYSLREVKLPPESSNSLTDCSSFTDAYSTSSIIKFTNLDYVGSPTVDTNFANFLSCLSEPIALTLYARISKLVVSGQNAYPTNLTSLRLPNAINSGFGGRSPQINVSYTNLDANALNLLFGDLPVVTGKTIDISGAAGASTCDKTIATTKGWTVTT